MQSIRACACRRRWTCLASSFHYAEHPEWSTTPSRGCLHHHRFPPRSLPAPTFVRLKSDSLSGSGSGSALLKKQQRQLVKLACWAAFLKVAVRLRGSMHTSLERAAPNMPRRLKSASPDRPARVSWLRQPLVVVLGFRSSMGSSLHLHHHPTDFQFSQFGFGFVVF